MRDLIHNNYAVVVLSRFLAIGIPMALLVIFHASNALGFEIWGPLLSTAFACGILISGSIILVFGTSAGLWKPFIAIVIIWVIVAYVYLQWEGDLLFSLSPIWLL